MAYYSPAVLSSVVVAAIWLLIFDPRGLSNQLVNFILNTPGIDHKWLAHSVMVQISTMLVYFWKYVGYFTIIFLVGLASIPHSIHEAAKMLYLFFTVKHEVPGMKGGSIHSCLPVIKVLEIPLTGYPVVFYAGIYPCAAAVNIRFYVVIIQVKTYVTVIFAIVVIPRIALLGTPYGF